MSHRHIPSTFLNTVLKNGVGRYICQLQRLTLKFCKSHADSYGMRSFIENDLLEFVRKHPGTVVYLQPRRHHRPHIVGEYLNGRQELLVVNSYNREEICQWVDYMRTRSGDEIVRFRKSWHTDTPSVQGIWTPYTNTDPANNLETFPSKKLSLFKPTEPTSTERLLQLAAELRGMDNVIVQEEERQVV